MARPRIHPLPSIAYLRQVFDYDPATGVFRHKPRPVDVFNGSQWNGRFAGKVAGCVNAIGYSFLKVNEYGMLLGHRVAWAMHYGEWPEFEIDHKDTNKLNNAIDNLRPATRKQNSANRPGRARSGFKGVLATKNGKRFTAAIGDGFGGITYLGTFDTPEIAHEAYKRAARAKHGAFANFDILRIGTIAATITFGVAA